MVIDSRIAERRAEVAEKRARRNVVRLVVLLAVVGLVAGVVWLLRSPFLSVDELVVEGVERSSVRSILTEQQVELGRPLVLIRGARVEGALERDPWVSDAELRVIWPDQVEVMITEKRPVIWAAINGEWSLLAGDGTILDEGGEPDPTFLVAEVAGEVRSDSPLLSELAAFAAEIPEVFRDGARIEINGDSATAMVENYTIRLGRPVDLGDKARVASRLIAAGIEHGSVLNLSSPLNPAVQVPGDSSNSEEQAEDDTTETTAPPTTPPPTTDVPITTVVG